MNVYEIVFSPTGGTMKAADMVAQTLADAVTLVDLSDSKKDFRSVALNKGDVAVIAVPSYGGRVPATAVARLAKLRGNDTRAVVMAVYGNRAYEDTLLELQDTAAEAGFAVIAAIAAVAEHSIAHQFATGRPDAQDQQQLETFAQSIKEKLASGELSMPHVPGNRPYKTSSVSMVPKATKACVSCGLCAQKCPVQAIDRLHPQNVDKKACISCMRCVAICPHHARRLHPIMQAAAGLALKKACAQRKEAELFI